VADRGADERPPGVGRVRAVRIWPVTPAARAVLLAWAQQPPDAGRGGGVAFAQSSAGEDRRCGGSRDRGELQVQPTLAAVAERNALLGVAMHLAHGVVDIKSAIWSLPARRPGTCFASPARSPAPTLSSCWTWLGVNVRRNVPSVEGARTPAKSRPMPPWRNRSRSSMESAPASIAPTTDAAFTLRSGHRRQAESCEKVSLTSHNAPGGAPVPSGECSRDRPVTPQHLGPFRGRLRAGRGIALWAPSMLALRRVRTAPGPYPRQIGAGEPLRDVPTLVPRVLLFVTLAEPTPLAVLARPGFVGAAPTHARHLPEQAAPSYTALLRQDGGESLSPPLKSSAPHGARGSGAQSVGEDSTRTI